MQTCALNLSVHVYKCCAKGEKRNVREIERQRAWNTTSQRPGKRKSSAEKKTTTKHKKKKNEENDDKVTEL